MPASTMTGTSTSSTMILMKSRAANPLFDPMGAASGHDGRRARAFTRSRAADRGRGTCRAARRSPPRPVVAVALHRLGVVGHADRPQSRMTSTFTKSPHPIARASRAMRTASSAVRAPDVFGSSVTPSGMASRMLPSLPRVRATHGQGDDLGARIAHGRLHEVEVEFPRPQDEARGERPSRPATKYPVRMPWISLPDRPLRPVASVSFLRVPARGARRRAPAAPRTGPPAGRTAPRRPRRPRRRRTRTAAAPRAA